MDASDVPASILVLAEDTDRVFSSPEALAELLRLEGINDLETAGLEDVSPRLLAGRSLILLGPADPAPETVELLLDHVRGGGGLICLAPGEAFAPRLGLKHPFRGVMHGRYRITLEGFSAESLPIRGWAQKYALKSEAEAGEIMPLLDPQDQPADAPAVIELRHGKGRIIVLAFDLAASIYLIRQGNPLLAGCRSSGYRRMRPSDLFTGWLEPRDTVRPVADLQCRFLRELVHRAWPDGSVLPWLWYYPADAKTVMILTSDDDQSTRKQFEQFVDACEAHGASATFYLWRPSAVDRPFLEDLAGRGFDFSIHPDLPPPTHPTREGRLTDHIRQFREVYGRDPSGSVRNHAITWSGYLDGARLEAEHGFTVDCNYFSLSKHTGDYMNGAGLPMPLVDLNGEVLPVFQLPTQFTDETVLRRQGFSWSLDLTPEAAIERVHGHLRRNAETDHSMICVNSHPVSFAQYSAPLWEPVLRLAKGDGIPVMNVHDFMDFWQRRRNTRLRPLPKGQTKPQSRVSVEDAAGVMAMPV